MTTAFQARYANQAALLPDGHQYTPLDLTASVATWELGDYSRDTHNKIQELVLEPVGSLCNRVRDPIFVAWLKTIFFLSFHLT